MTGGHSCIYLVFEIGRLLNCRRPHLGVASYMIIFKRFINKVLYKTILMLFNNNVFNFVETYYYNKQVYLVQK